MVSPGVVAGVGLLGQVTNQSPTPAVQTRHQLGHRSLLGGRSVRESSMTSTDARDVAYFLSPGATPSDGGTFRAMDAVILDDEIAPRAGRRADRLRALGRRAAGDARRPRRDVRRASPLSDAVERTDHVVSDDPHVVVRVHRPKGVDGPLPCVYSIHGGGYVLGSYDMDDAKFDRYVRALPVRRRVGRVPPRARDARTPVRSTTATPGCGGRTSTPTSSASRPIASASRASSAGGGLAAALALLARDRGEVPVAFQLLECPMIDDRQITSSSRLDGLPIWSRESNDVRVAQLPRRALRRRRPGVRGRGPRDRSRRACRRRW